MGMRQCYTITLEYIVVNIMKLHSQTTPGNGAVSVHIRRFIVRTCI